MSIDFKRIEFQKRLKCLYSVYPAAKETYESRTIEFGRQNSECHILEIKTSRVWREMKIYHFYQKSDTEKFIVEEFHIYGLKADPIFSNKTEGFAKCYHKKHIFYKGFPKDIREELYAKLDLIYVELI